MKAPSYKTKIILGSGSAEGYAKALCNAAMSLNENDLSNLTDQVGHEIIERLIVAEHALEKANDMLLTAIGYDGPRP